MKVKSPSDLNHLFLVSLEWMWTQKGRLDKNSKATRIDMNQIQIWLSSQYLDSVKRAPDIRSVSLSKRAADRTGPGTFEQRILELLAILFHGLSCVSKDRLKNVCLALCRWSYSPGNMAAILRFKWLLPFEYVKINNSVRSQTFYTQALPGLREKAQVSCFRSWKSNILVSKVWTSGSCEIHEQEMKERGGLGDSSPNKKQ